MYWWIAFGLAGASLILSVATLYVLLGVRRSARRSERAGDERLEILREQQQRLAVLREQRRMLDEELEWRRSVMEGEGSVLELEASSEANGQPVNGRPKARSWLRRVIGRMGG